MATDRFYICDACEHKQWVPRLFDALKECAAANNPRCPRCHSTMVTELTFKFGLEAGDDTCRILDSFLPTDINEWQQNDLSVVQYYPFLVVVRSVADSNLSFWLPYWHIVTKSDGTVNTKYGQWAPLIDSETFASFTKQARAKGYDI